MAFLKNIAESIAKRTLPAVAKNIFPNESQKLTSFNEKLDNARDIFNKAKKDVISTGEGFDGFTPVTKKALKQLKQGKFGTTEEEQTNMYMKSLGLDGLMSDGSGGDSTDDLDALLNSLGGPTEVTNEGDTNTLEYTDNSDRSTTNVVNVMNPNGLSPNVITAGEAVIGERLTHAANVSGEIGTRLIGLTSRIAHNLDTITSIMSEQAVQFYQASLEHYKVQSQLAVKFEEGLPLVFDYYAELKKKKDAAALKASNMDSNEFNIDNMLDPQRAMEKMTSGTFEQLFGGEINPIKIGLESFSQDPLGIMIAAGVGSLITNAFGNQIETIKNTIDAIQFKAQDTLEEWSNTIDDGTSPLKSIKKALGETLKLSRRTDTKVKIGAFSADEMPYNKQANKAIVQVIPMYLAKILKAVSGAKSHEVYDWENGKFSSDKTLNTKTKRLVGDINNGDYVGGLGQSLKFGMMTSTTMNEATKKKIKDKMLFHALSRNSGSLDLRNLDMGDPNSNAAYQQYLASMSAADFRSLSATFRRHKYDRMKQLQQFENGLSNSGLETAAILGNKQYSINEEHGGVAPIPPNGGGGNGGGGPNPPGPIPPVPPVPPNGGGNGGGGGPNSGNILEQWANWFSLKFASLKVWLGNVSGKFAHYMTTIGGKLVTGFTNHVLTPFKNLLSSDGTNSGNQSLKDLIAERFTNSVLIPFKARLLGVNREDQNAKDTSLWNSIQHRVNVSILNPLKGQLLGKARDDQDTVNSSLWNSIKFRMNESIFIPLKAKILGVERDDHLARDRGFLEIIKYRFDQSILNPLKGKLLGKDKDSDEVANSSLFKAFKYRFEESVLIPLKHSLLGKENVDRAAAAGTGLLKAIGTRIDQSLLFPMKKWLFGGNENKAKSFNILKALSHRLDRSVLFPLKRILLGGDERTGAQIHRTSFLQAIKTGWTERIVHPLNSLLFGDDKRRNGFFSNLRDVMSPFFNKLIFGNDQASKAGLWENIKGQGKKLWTNVWSGFKERFITPAANALKELFGPALKELGTALKDEFKHFGGKIMESIGGKIKGSMEGGIKAGAKNLFKNVFGDETVKLLQDNVIKPLKDLTNKLTDGITKIFKFFLRAPANLIKGVTDSVKINRIKQGRGNYSPEEMARLKALEESGKIFNFMNLDGTHALNNATANNRISNAGSNNGEPRQGIFSRIFGRSNNSNANGSGNTGNSGSIGSNNRRNASNGLSQSSTTSHGSQTGGIYTPHNGGLGLFSNLSRGSITASSNAHVDVAGSINRVANVEESLAGTTGRLARITEFLQRQLAEIKTQIGDKADRLKNGIRSRRNNRITSNHISALNGEHEHLPVSVGVSKIAHRMEILAPLMVKSSTETGQILAFMHGNLSKVDNRLENVVKLLRKKNGDASGFRGSDNGKVSFFRNPALWLAQKVNGLFSLGFNVLGTLGKSVGKVALGILSLPGKMAKSASKFIGSLGNVLLDAASASIKFTSGLAKGAINAFSSMLSGLGTGLGKLVSGLASAAGGLAKALGSTIEATGKFAANIIGPLGKALGEVTGAVLKGFGPLMSTLMKGIASLAEGVRVVATEIAKFGWGTLKFLGRFAGNMAHGLTGGRFAKFSGGSGSKITNFKELLSESTTNPLKVIVVDGKVGTYTYKKNKRREIRSTTRIDNVETRSLLGKAKDKAKEIKNGLFDAIKGILGNAAGAALGTAAGSVATSAGKGIFGVLTAGMSKLGNIITIATAAIIANTKKLSGGLGDFVKRRRGPRVGPPRPPTGGNGLLSRARGLFSRTPNPNPATGGRITNALRSTGGIVRNGATRVGAMGGGSVGTAGSFLGKWGGRLVKGAGIGAAVGIGGNMIADQFFEKGSTAHSAVATGSTYAGYGATLGSFILPGIGTAIGGVIGGLIGVIKETGPKLLKWFETKFETQIRDATEYFVKIPERIAGFANALPDKIQAFVEKIPEVLSGWMDSLPSKIAKVFTNDVTVNENGEIEEEKPSILGRMFVALGRATVGVIKALPKIAVSLLEGLVKVGISVGVTAAAYVGKVITTGFYAIGDSLHMGINNARIAAMGWLGSIPVIGSKIGWDAKRVEEEKKKANAEYAATAAKREASLKDYTAGTKDLVKTLTNWSFAKDMTTGVSASTTNRDAYEKAMSDSMGNKDKALDAFATATGRSVDDAKKEFEGQRQEAEYREITKNRVATQGSDLTLAKNTPDDLQNVTKLGSNYFGGSAGYIAAQTNKINDPNGLAYNGGAGGEGASGSNGEDVSAGYANAITNGSGGTLGMIPHATGKGWNGVKNTILKAAEIVGIDPRLMAGIAAVESGFDPNARSGSSSAAGLFQFVKGTWEAMIRQYGAKYGITPGTSPLDSRANALLGAEYIKTNAQMAQKVKGSVTPVDVYMGHFMGTGGGRSFIAQMKSNPNAIAANLFPSAARANNAIFYPNGRAATLAEVYAGFYQKLKYKAAAHGANLDNLGASPSGSVVNTAKMNGGTEANSGAPIKVNTDPNAAAEIKKYARFKDNSVNVDGLHPTFSSLMAKAFKEYYDRTGRKAQINSAFRSIKEQEALFAKYGPGRAARPGSSLHNYGFAIDINSVDGNSMDSLGILGKYGLARPIPGEKWHIQPRGIDKTMAKRGIYSSDAANNQNVAINQAQSNRLVNLAENNSARFNTAIGVKADGSRLGDVENAQAKKMLEGYGRINAMLSNKPVPKSPVGAPTAPATEKAINKAIPPTIAKPTGGLSGYGMGSGGSTATPTTPNVGAKVASGTANNTPTTAKETTATTSGTTVNATATVKDSTAQKAKSNAATAASIQTNNKIENPPTQDFSSNDGAIIAELKKQNQLLTEIRDSSAITAKKDPMSNNFFSGGTPSKDALAESKKQVIMARDNIKSRNYAMNEFPEYLNPSIGAISAAKVGGSA